MKTVLVSQFWSIQLSHRISRGVMEYISDHEMWEILSVGATESELSSAAGWPVDGLIVPVVSRKLADLCMQFNKPCVSTHGGDPYPGIPQSDVDNYAAGAAAADYFIAKGYERPSVMGNTRLVGHKLRQDGFIDRMKEKDRPVDVFHVEMHGTNTEKKLEMIQAHLAVMELPAAAYCSDDSSAFHLNLACHKQGINIPGQLCILATENDTKFCEGISPAISSLDLPYQEVGIKAAELLDGMMSGDAPPREPVLLPPRGVRERESTR